MKPINQKLNNLPQSPGVYQFLDKDNNIIYIGKAKNLRARVRQYFNGDDERHQIPYLMKEVADFDYTIVNTEIESLYLERTLIQNYKPKYNIDLKDDKNYAFIQINYSYEIPQVEVIRKINTNKLQITIRQSADKFQTNFKSKTPKLKTTPYPLPATHSAYFGPFTNAKKIRNLIFTARKTFGLCSAQKIGKPCFYFHLHQCPGVCGRVISVSEYKKHLEKIKLFFLGRITPTIKNIQTEMTALAKAKKFEKAAKLRDQLKTLKILEERQNVIIPKPVNWDVLGLACEEKAVCVNLFKIRLGKLIDKINFIYNDPNHSVLNIVETFLEDYYTQNSEAPKEIFLPIQPQNKNLIIKLIKDRFKRTVKFIVPKKGKTLNLFKLSQTNAEEYLKNYLNQNAGNLDKIQRGLIQIKEILKLPTIPKRIECFDISNIQGTNPVGSMVVFENGMPKKSEYRKFKIQSKSTPDDFEMMREMLARRMAKSASESKSEILNQKSETNPKLQTQNSKPWDLPDLIVIDGGKGQLNVAVETINNPQLTIHIIGLAKRIEEIFLPNQPKPIILSHDNPGLQLLQRLRDEAHRFGITFHRQLRSKYAIKSALDDIKGIGSKTKKLLKTKFGTVENIRKAKLEELVEIVGNKLANKIKSSL